MDAQVVDLLRTNLHEVFGQREPEAREEAARRTYAPDVTFTDDEGTLRGWTAVVDKAAALLAGAPATFVFREDSPPYAGTDRAALAWRFGPPDGEPVARGVDVVTVVDGRITELLTLLTS